MTAAKRAALLLLVMLLAAPAAAQTRVSLELVLAVDTSLSVDDKEYELQMRGIAAAFRAPEVVDLIGKHTGGVAVAILQWSGIADEESVRWRHLTDLRSIEDYALEIGQIERWPYGYLTGIGEAVYASIDQIERNAYIGRERKIDVSGDGRSNSGPDPAEARDAAIARGITVNGLAILNAEQGLSDYYASQVIGGSEAFLIEAVDYRAFAEAIQKKLLRELELKVAGAPDPPRFARAPALYVTHD
jgi:hypothetical protein